MPKISKLIKKRLPIFIVSALLLVVFYSFSFLVKEDLFTRFDFDMTVRVQNNIPFKFDPFLSSFSLLGSFEATLIMLTVFILLRRKIQGFILIGMFGFMHVVEIIGKAFLDHPGTPFLFHRYSLDVIFPSSYVQPGGSYPSGHSMRTSYLAILFIYAISRSKLSKPIKISLYTLIGLIVVLMFISRISLGEHWTTDIIGGAILGAAFAVLSFIFI